MGRVRSAAVGALILLAQGCGSPRGLSGEEEAAREAGAGYAQPRLHRDLPALEDPVTTDDLLRHAFRANAALEAAWHRWQAALARVGIASSWEQPSLSFEYLTSSGEMRRWDRTTLALSQPVPLAGRRGIEARMALTEARAARHDFEHAKFDVQRRVLQAAAEYAYLGKAIAAAREEEALAALAAESLEARVAAGTAPAAAALAARQEVDAAQDRAAVLQAQAAALAGEMSALLGRDARLPLPYPTDEHVEMYRLTDAEILAHASRRNHEILHMAEEARVRQDALALARRAWVPELSIGYETMGDIEASLMGMLMLPLRAGRIRAGVRSTNASLDMARAALDAARDDVRGRTIAALSMARDAERQERLFRETLVPRAGEIVALARARYEAPAGAAAAAGMSPPPAGRAPASGGMGMSAGGATGGAVGGMPGAAGADPYREWIEARRGEIALRIGGDRAHMALAMAVAELEEILALDRGRWVDPPGGEEEGEGDDDDRDR